MVKVATIEAPLGTIKNKEKEVRLLDQLVQVQVFIARSTRTGSVGNYNGLQKLKDEI